ncbi:MAG: response regulator, partial [Verrucomicrobiota bacterium]
TDTGVVQVKLSSEWGDDELSKCLIKIEVSDTGPGIREDEREKIFTKFTRGDNSASRKHKGTGLGLYICRKVTRLLGGDVLLDSVEGDGAAFTIQIKADLPDHTDYRKRPAVPLNDEVELSKQCPIDIIIVDDIASNIMLATSFLKKLGYVPKAAFQSADETLAYLEKDTADLILMDVEMPEVNGLELSRMIREREIMASSGLCPIQIIAVTAGVLPEERRRCFDAGMNGYMSKPLTKNSLIRNLQNSHDYISAYEPQLLAR